MNRKALLWVTGIGVLAAVTFLSGWDSITEVWSGVAAPTLITFLAALFALQVATMAMTAYQWHVLLRKEDPSLRFRDVFQVHLAGNFVESVTPSSKLGGEAAKVYLFRRRTGACYHTLTSFLLVHKYVSLLPFLAICAAFLVAAPFLIALPAAVYAAFVMLAIPLGLLAWSINRGPRPAGHRPEAPGLRGRAAKAVDYLATAASRSRELSPPAERRSLFLLSFVVWGLYPVKIFLVASLLGIEIGLTLAIAATYAAYLVSMLPLTPGGLGTFEGTLALVLSINGVPFAAGMALALMARTVTFWFPLAISAAATALLARARPSGDADAC